MAIFDAPPVSAQAIREHERVDLDPDPGKPSLLMMFLAVLAGPTSVSVGFIAQDRYGVPFTVACVAFALSCAAHSRVARIEYDRWERWKNRQKPL